MVRQPLLVDLTIEPTSFFRPYIKIVFNPSKESQVALTALIDTRVVCSIIREACVPKDCYVPTQVSFGSASGEGFYNRKYTRPIEVKPFGIRHEFIAFNHTSEDILLGSDFLSLIASFAFFPEGFSYTIHNPMDGKAHLFQVSWVEKHSIFGEGEKRKI